MNPIRRLSELGQSPWLDQIQRSFLKNGQLRRWIDEDGLKGMTSNPAIFEKAITGSQDYDGAITEALTERDWDPKSLYESLAIQDIQAASDLFRPVYEKSAGADGYVSLEVSPYLARDTRGTLEEARRLWKAVGRDNILIKVPATREGLPAIRRLLSEGINVNITLLFSRKVYDEVIEAYFSGLESCSRELSKMASVASFFVSRVDSLVDPLIAEQCQADCEPERERALRSLEGKIAIANAKLAYQRFLEAFSGERWNRLRERGARPQRLLWASTSTKNPRYPDVYYVESLIGDQTVDTMPLKTLDAFRDHGRARPALTEGVSEARAQLELLEKFNISLEQVTDLLTEEAIGLFVKPFDLLLSALERKRRALLGDRINGYSVAVPSDMELIVNDHIRQAASSGLVCRLWQRDAALWTGKDESRWLGWLDIVPREQEILARDGGEIRELVSGVRQDGFTHALLIGMGGSSLAPEVFSAVFRPEAGFLKLRVLDSIDPSEIKAAEDAIDLTRTLFVISSKSGGTLEPNLLFEYFWGRMTALQAERGHGANESGDRALLGRRFVAITDPGSPLERLAASLGFRKVLFGDPGIGGRYSALSSFGLAPAALCGIDLTRLLERTRMMMISCSRWVPPFENPGAQLGIALGLLGRHGRNKATFVSSEELRELQLWLEQLLAESTGKQGKGLIPVSGEPLGVPETYGNDRIFIYLKLERGSDERACRETEERLEELQKSGQPVIRIFVRDRINLGQEFFRWEIATAVAGSVLAIDPFDQPDVEASKEATRKLTAQYESSGRFEIAGEKLLYRSSGADGIRAFAPQPMVPFFFDRSGRTQGLEDLFHGLFESLRLSDYFAILAYLPREPVAERELSKLRIMVRNHCRVATLLQFGPRYLHSTGQAFKGGPNSGVFLHLIGDNALDLAVPARHYTFGVVKAAQAEGDLEILAGRGRRVLKLEVGTDLAAVFGKLHMAFRHALRLTRPLNNQVNTEGVNRELAQRMARRTA